MRRIFRRCFMLFCIITLIMMTGSPVFAKTKKIKQLQNDQAISSIWNGQGKDIQIRYFGRDGLLWTFENKDKDTEIFHFDGSSVEQIEDFRGYEIEKVEQDGIQVWVESLNTDFDHFRLFYKMDGKKKVIKDYNEMTLRNLQITYPYITWEEICNGVKTTYKYNVESKELSSNASFGATLDSFYKFDQQNRKEYLRSFKIHDYEYGRVKDWASTDKYLGWEKAKNIYLSDPQTNPGYYKLTDQPKKTELLGMDDTYTYWLEKEGLATYSFEDKHVSVLPLHEVSPELTQELWSAFRSAEVFNGKIAIASEDDSKLQVYLINYHQLSSNFNAESLKKYQPEFINSKYVAGIHGHLSYGASFIVSSPEYLAWSEDGWSSELKYKKLTDSRTYLVPGKWFSAKFVGKDLYALGYAIKRDESATDDENDNPYSNTYGLYRIDFGQGVAKLVQSLDNYGFFGNGLLEDSGKIYWIEDHKDWIGCYDPKNDQVDYPVSNVKYMQSFAVHNDTFVWIEEDDDEEHLQIKLQRMGEKPLTIAKWSREDKDIDELAFDGKRIVWNQAENNLSKVVLYDLGSNQEKTIYSTKDRRAAQHLQISDNVIYFIGPNGRSRLPLQRYDIATGKIIVLDKDADNYFVQGDKVFLSVHAAESNKNDHYYLIGKKNKSSKGIALRYKWKDLSRNHQQKWYDLQYSFLPQDIHIKIREDDYTWKKLLDDIDVWNDAIKNEPDEIEVSVSL
ncbi:hypothetical protein ACQCN2_22450 [Brevibacillus ginsengisoli]|uniref:hypothetical protein n=1 Tax=Brevibacillus ginsengisoli TaxID=363854 RepID=UPI003CFB8129